MGKGRFIIKRVGVGGDGLDVPAFNTQRSMLSFRISSAVDKCDEKLTESRWNDCTQIREGSTRPEFVNKVFSTRNKCFLSLVRLLALLNVSNMSSKVLFGCFQIVLCVKTRKWRTRKEEDSDGQSWRNDRQQMLKKILFKRLFSLPDS